MTNIATMNTQDQHPNRYTSGCRCDNCHILYAKARAASRAKYKARTPHEIEVDRAILRPTGRKQCRSCRRSLQLTSFRPVAREHDGLQTTCRACEAAYATVRAELGKLVRRNHDGHHVCAYCGNNASTIDNVRPLSRGGRLRVENVVFACKRCNITKGAKDLRTFLAATGYTLTRHPKLKTR